MTKGEEHAAEWVGYANMTDSQQAALACHFDAAIAEAVATEREAICGMIQRVIDNCRECDISHDCDRCASDHLLIDGIRKLGEP
jgi:hypothetical protein